MDIDEVATDQKARIHFLSLVEWRLAQITGVVRWLSADSLVDEVTGEGYYVAWVEVPTDELAKLGNGIKITAGRLLLRPIVGGPGVMRPSVNS